MASKSTKTSTAAHQKGREPLEDSISDMEVEKQGDRQLGEVQPQGRSEFCGSDGM